MGRKKWLWSGSLPSRWRSRPNTFREGSLGRLERRAGLSVCLPMQQVYRQKKDLQKVQLWRVRDTRSPPKVQVHAHASEKNRLAETSKRSQGTTEDAQESRKAHYVKTNY